jgi:hypothetical protein
LAFTVVATVVLLYALYHFAISREGAIPPADTLKYSQLYLDAFKVIIVSFFVAMLGILIPVLSREAKESFERLKESRVAYSEAKTGVTYLPIRLCTMSFADASVLIQRVHFQKHQAELYGELDQHVKRVGTTRDIWTDQLYERLIGYLTVLESHAEDWDGMKPHQRLEKLLKRREFHERDEKGESVFFSRLRTPKTSSPS